MDIEAIKSKLYVGMEVASFAALCRLLGEEPTKGNSRKSQERRFRRYFDWVKAEKGNSLTITAVYDEPKPDSIRENDLYAEDILTCVRWGFVNGARWGDIPENVRTYSLAQILSLCGFVMPWWSTKEEDVMYEFSILQKSGAIGECTQKEAKRLLNKLGQHIGEHCAKTIDGGLRRLDEKGYIEDYRKELWVSSDGERRPATYREELRYEEIAAEVKESMGITLTNLYNSSEYYKRLNRRLFEELGLSAAWPLRRIEMRAPFDAVTREEYDAARRRINQRTAALFPGYAKRDLEKDVAKVEEDVWGSADEEMLWVLEAFGYTPDDMYEVFYRSPDESLSQRRIIADWFVRDGTKESFLQMVERDRARMREKAERRSEGDDIEIDDSLLDSLLGED